MGKKLSACPWRSPCRNLFCTTIYVNIQFSSVPVRGDVHAAPGAAPARAYRSAGHHDCSAGARLKSFLLSSCGASAFLVRCNAAYSCVDSGENLNNALLATYFLFDTWSVSAECPHCMRCSTLEGSLDTKPLDAPETQHFFRMLGETFNSWCAKCLRDYGS
jgi:hypothetical protein